MPTTTFLANELLDHVFGGADYTRPGTLHVSLHTGTPGDAGSSEVSGNNYSRSAVTNNATNWPAAAGKEQDNGEDVPFATPSGPWGTVTHFGVWDAASGGNILGWGALTTSEAPDDGDTVSFPAGTLTIGMDAP